jgi:hypothetical protein
VDSARQHAEIVAILCFVILSAFFARRTYAVGQCH